MDFGKYKYELAKKAKENKKSQKNFSVKEIKFRIKIDTHDFNTKINRGIKFLQDGHRLKIIIMFRGREVVYKDSGYELQDRIIEALSEYGTVEKKGRLEGYNIQFQVVPKNKK
jgi:translation initiation factor IF-3